MNTNVSLKAGDNFYDWCLNNNRQDLIEEFNSKDIDIKEVIFCWKKDKKTVNYNWKCRTCGYEFSTSIGHRVHHNSGCRRCATRKINEDLNKKKTQSGKSLADKFPELIEEWDYELNDIDPSDITYGSQQKVHWICENGHKFVASVNARTAGGCGCPECEKFRHTSFSEQALFFYVKKYFPGAVNGDKHLGIELDIYIPEKNIGIEYDGYEWHKDKQVSEKKKNKIAKKNLSKFIRVRDLGLVDYNDVICFYRDDRSSDVSLVSVISSVLCYLGIKYPDVELTKDRREIVSQYQKGAKLNSFGVLYPDIAAEWDYKANGSFEPTDFGPTSKYEAHWKRNYRDPTTGKKFTFKWTCRIADRVLKSVGCPYLSNKKVWIGYNDFATTNPEIAKLFDYEMNEKMGIEGTPETFTNGSTNKKYYWKLECGHSVLRTPCQMAKGIIQCDKCYTKMNMKGASEKLAA